jgi:hypothetical protein
MLMLVYRETQTPTFYHMNINNAHMSNQLSIRIVSCKLIIFLICSSGMIPQGMYSEETNTTEMTLN